MSNSVTACQEWRVIDVNHDNTNGTVDLVSKYAIADGSTDYSFRNSKNGYKDSDDDVNWINRNDVYQNGYAREWLNNALLNGFSGDIKNAMRTMDVECMQWNCYDGNTRDFAQSMHLQDKVKIPSLTESGFDSGLRSSRFTGVNKMDYSPINLDNYKEGSLYPGLTSAQDVCFDYIDNAGSNVVYSGGYQSGFTTRSYLIDTGYWDDTDGHHSTSIAYLAFTQLYGNTKNSVIRGSYLAGGSTLALVPIIRF